MALTSLFPRTSFSPAAGLTTPGFTVLGMAAIGLSVACSSSGASQSPGTSSADLPGDVGDDDGRGGSGSGTDGPVLVITECEVKLPPTGALCSCFYDDCESTVLQCRCSADCWGAEDGCMIVVPESGPVSDHPALESCEIGCEWVDQSGDGEFVDPEHVQCTVKNCSEPIPSEPPPSRPSDPVVTDPPSGDDPVPPPVSDVACPVPVPGPTTVAGPVWGEYNIPFYVPFSTYAFGTAHAWKLSVASGIGNFRVVPSFLLATSLKEAFLGCSNELPRWEPGMTGINYKWGNSVDKDGCFQIESTTAYVEVDHHFPEVNTALGHERLVSSQLQDELGRDNFVSSAMLATYYYLWVYGMMTTDLYGIDDPSEWFSTAADPYAFEKTMALIYNRGAWGGVTVVGCHDTVIEQCGVGFADYVPQIAGAVQAMEAELAKDNCYDEPITEADVRKYVQEVAVVWKDVDVAAAEAAAVAAFQAASGGAAEAGFQQVAMPVLDAIDGVFGIQLACPQEKLAYWYGHINAQCPGAE